METAIFTAAFADAPADVRTLVEQALWVDAAERAAQAGAEPPPIEVAPGIKNTLRIAATSPTP